MIHLLESYCSKSTLPVKIFLCGVASSYIFRSHETELHDMSECVHMHLGISSLCATSRLFCAGLHVTYGGRGLWRVEIEGRHMSVCKKKRCYCHDLWTTTWQSSPCKQSLFPLPLSRLESKSWQTVGPLNIISRGLFLNEKITKSEWWIGSIKLPTRKKAQKAIPKWLLSAECWKMLILTKTALEEHILDLYTFSLVAGLRNMAN